MSDLRNPKLIYLKAGLFLSVGIISSVLILVQLPTLKVALLLALAIWAFARCYYFAFYVIEKYVDPRFKFSGLFDFLVYLVRKPRL